MFLGDHARSMPDKAALINANTGETLSYRDLDERSNRFAQFLYFQGLRRGDHIAVFMENNMRFLEIAWAATRSGLYLTAVNRYLTADEAAYVVNDSGARVLVSSAACQLAARELPDKIPNCRHRLMVDDVIAGWESFEAAVAEQPSRPLDEEWLGDTMLYSSGTTGRPKGIKRSLLDIKVGEETRRRDIVLHYGFSGETVYLSPAPLYHAAPMCYVMGTQFLGGTVVMMEKFDALEALRFIERHRVTHSQFVPTMFVRMLRLPEEDRSRFDLSSHQVAIHAAAPCPVEIKRRMIEWWGPILHEYYAGTEGNGSTHITSEEWLARPGSVGRAHTGIVHICDEEGRELPPDEIGLVYFERDEMPFAYHNDPEKTSTAQHSVHPNWSTLGDVGRLDEDGYLYLTDRKSFMIISGGVNIYPQAIEDALIMHPSVADVAVIGVPNADMGEEVKAVVEPAVGVVPEGALADELIAFARTKLAGYMIPRSIDFVDALPRLPTGKLYKRVLREQYWGARPSPSASD